jgi:tetratricopeptide (TPR) repeat protein
MLSTFSRGLFLLLMISMGILVTVLVVSGDGLPSLVVASDTPDPMDEQFEQVRMLVYQNLPQPSDEALHLAEAMVADAPGDARSQAAYALVLTTYNRNEEAVQAVILAIEADPNWSTPYAYLALAYIKRGHYHIAMQGAQTAMKLDANDIDSRWAYAVVLDTMQYYAEAAHVYQSAIDLKPELAGLYDALAQVYLKQQNVDAAIATYEHLLTVQPDNMYGQEQMCRLNPPCNNSR